MKSAWSLLLLCLTGVVLILMAVDPSWAGGENQVAMVVDFGNGQIAAKCVSFPEDSITGFEALRRSGLPVETDYQTGGAAICRIDGQGCPADDCFCACRGGGDCKYWSYWHFVDGTWNYSVAGSGIYRLQDGAVDGWVWGLGAVDQAKPPPALSFNEICVDGNMASPTVAVTPKPTSTPMILPTRAPTESAPNPTATTLVVRPTETVVTAALPTMSMTEDAGPTSLPTTDSGQADTPTPAVLLNAGETPVPVATMSMQNNEPYPIQSGGGGPTASLPMPDASTPAPPQPEDEGIALAPPPEEIAELGVGGGLVDHTQSDAPATPTSTPAVVSAVVGMGVTIDKPLAAPSTSQVEESSPWVSYMGFAGLLLLLAALGLLAARRRGNYPGGDAR